MTIAAMDMEAPDTTKLAQSNPLDAPKRVRTYATDMSAEISRKGSTLAAIVAAEEEEARKRRAEALAPTENGRPHYSRLALVGSVLFILLGGGILAGTYYFSGEDGVARGTLDPKVLVVNKTLTVREEQNRALATTLGSTRFQTTLPIGEAADYTVELLATSTTPTTLLQKLNVPNALIREARTVTVGVHSFGRIQPFVIIEISQFDRAFAATLAWEPDMGRSLGAFFRPFNGTVPPTLTFTDAVFRNIDIRQSQSDWPIVYAFPKKDLLVITTNTQTLQEVVARLAAARTGKSN